MLLPSVFPCDGMNRSVAHSRPSILLSREPATSARPNDILSSCRVLQAILTPSSAIQHTTANATNLQRPRLVRTSAQSQYNLHNRSDRISKKTSPLSPQLKPRTIKRRRDDDLPAPTRPHHERTLSDASTLASTSPDLKGQSELIPLPIPSPMLDQENANAMDIDTRLSSSQGEVQAGPSPYSTPKRRRIAPLSLPLGLTTQDYESLNMPPGYGENNSQEAVFSNSDWTPEDDEALVTLLLDKFRVSKWDWNECARLLGKDKDSMGRRWRVLVGNGQIGLRRADTRMYGGNRRTGLGNMIFDDRDGR